MQHVRRCFWPSSKNSAARVVWYQCPRSLTWHRQRPEAGDLAAAVVGLMLREQERKHCEVDGDTASE